MLKCVKNMFTFFKPLWNIQSNNNNSNNNNLDGGGGRGMLLSSLRGGSPSHTLKTPDLDDILKNLQINCQLFFHFPLCAANFEKLNVVQV